MTSIHAQICIKHYEKPEANPIITDGNAEDILRIAAEASGVSEDKLKSDSRMEQVVIVRHIYCHIAHTIAKLPLKSISASINRHHTSAIHGRNKVAGYLEVKDKDYTLMYAKILERIALEFEIPLPHDKGRFDKIF